MPVFHTKTIESILEPVAQQVIKVWGDSFFLTVETVIELSRLSRNSPEFLSKFWLFALI